MQRMDGLYQEEKAELARRRQRRRDHLRRHRSALGPEERRELETLEREEAQTSPEETHL